MRLGTTRIDASQEILKIDDDVPGNPGFLVRDRVDEEVGHELRLGGSWIGDWNIDRMFSVTVSGDTSMKSW
jgi:hypothetical protein